MFLKLMQVVLCSPWNTNACKIRDGGCRRKKVRNGGKMRGANCSDTRVCSICNVVHLPIVHKYVLLLANRSSLALELCCIYSGSWQLILQVVTSQGAFSRKLLLCIRCSYLSVNLNYAFPEFYFVEKLNCFYFLSNIKLPKTPLSIKMMRFRKKLHQDETAAMNETFPKSVWKTWILWFEQLMNCFLKLHITMFFSSKY